ncbi:uncharacterized protein LOC104266093 isoform X2 [Ciona intestinalis]
METDWKTNDDLRLELERYVCESTPRKLILQYMERDFSEYQLSLRTLSRRLKHFSLKYVDDDVTQSEVSEAIGKELIGAGKDLGYRAMHRKIRDIYGLNVSRDTVYTTMKELNPQGLKSRQLESKHQRSNDHLFSKGPNWVHSLDGHCILMGYQRSTFPLAVYGCIDTCSRKLLWLRIWTDNADPKLIGKWYFDHIYISRKIASMIRVGRGSETGIMATMQAYITNNIEASSISPMESVIYRKSTSNQIERWWRELHERLEKYFKEQLRYLKDHGLYDPQNVMDRHILAFVYIPVLEREMKNFVDSWNTHRIRRQKDSLLPNGSYVSDEILKKAAEMSGVLSVPSDYLPAQVRKMLTEILPNSEETETHKCVDAFLFVQKETKRIINENISTKLL